MAATKISSLRTVLGIAAMGSLLLGLTACNATEGLGRDVSATGKAINAIAEKTKP